mmetsp:Transcript_27328/g.33337  ORF Transcript_27328/g.33337 Transcript_27328/m.33337 type:complete len:243 (+) Transcript_27328:393-1121(+)
MVGQRLEALHWVWHGQCLTRWLVEKAIHISAQAEESSLATIHLDGSIKCCARLHWYICITEKDVIAHKSGSTQLRGRGFLGDQLGVVSFTIMFHVMWVEIMEGLTRPRGLMGLTLSTLQHVVDLEAGVVDLCVPFCGHGLWEGPGISTGLGEVKNHVLNQRTSENIVVLKGWPLIQQLVVLSSGSTAIKGFPIPLQGGLILGIIILTLRILHGGSQMVVVEVVLLHEGLPILVCIQPLRLRE